MGDALAINPGYGLSKFDQITGAAKNLATNITAGVSKKLMPAKVEAKELHAALPLTMKADLVKCSRDCVKVLDEHGVIDFIKKIEVQDDEGVDVGATIIELANKSKSAIDANPALKKSLESLKTQVTNYSGVKGYNRYTMVRLIRDVVEAEMQNLNMGFLTGALITTVLGALGSLPDVSPAYPPPAPKPPPPPPPPRSFPTSKRN